MEENRVIVINLDEKISGPLAQAEDKPIVLNLKKEKKKKSKRRYSKGLEEVQEMERHLTRSMHRVARATEKGIASYRKRSQKSAEEKKDGAIKDFIPNSGRAISLTLKEISPLPDDLAKVMDTERNRRRLRRQLRALSRTLERWRW
jgi:hypothetical protein